MTQYSYETLPTIDISPFDVECYPYYGDTIGLEEDPLQSRLHRLGAQYYEFEPIIAPFTHFPTGYIELVKEPRFNADEVIAFIEGSDGA